MCALQASYTVGDLADILRLVYGLAAADIINALTQVRALMVYSAA